MCRSSGTSGDSLQKSSGKEKESMALSNKLVIDSRREFVNKIIAEIENGVRPSKALWRENISQRPYNPLSGYQYRGGNCARLMYAANENGYKDPRWLTFRQASDAGYHIRRGEKSVLLEKWIFEKTVREENEQGKIEEIHKQLENPICNYFRVFNAEQMDGIEPLPEIVPMEHNQMLQTAEDFIKSSQCAILELKQDRAFYDPKQDRIVLPPRDYFKNQESFLSVLLHEMSHSTGHETRLNRPLMHRFGTEEYAREELNAELSSMFLQLDLGIELKGELMEDHAGYLSSWIQMLKKDPNILFQVVRQADRISEYLMENYEQHRIKEQKQERIQSVSEEKTMGTDRSLNFLMEPQVTILWSESGELEAGEKLPFSKANELFGQLDREASAGQGYDKTKFQVEYMFHGEMDHYEGRQDFGDGDGTLIQHMQSFYEFYLQDETWKRHVIDLGGKEAWEEESGKIETFLNETIPYLKLHCNLSQLEQSAREHLNAGEALTAGETTYYQALLSYVRDGREMLNRGDYQLPEVPQMRNQRKPAAEQPEILDTGRQMEEAAAADQSAYAGQGSENPVSYYPIDESGAKLAKEMNSFSDYEAGSATSEYQKLVNRAAEIARNQKEQVDPIYHLKIDALVDRYARKLAENMNRQFEIDARMPSVLISGGGNLSVRRKEKQNAARYKNAHEREKIDHILQKIQSTGKGGISADRPDAVLKLQQKLEKLEKEQAMMKAVNAYYRKYKTLDGCPELTKDQIKQLQQEMEHPWHREEKPYASFQLSNHNANIRRLKQRLETLTVHQSMNYPEWEFSGGKMVANKEVNRLQIIFDEKPEEITRSELKKNGFRWSPKMKVWQRQLNQNAYRAANHISAIQPITGEKPSQLYQRHLEKEENEKPLISEDEVDLDQEREVIVNEAAEYGFTPEEFKNRILKSQPTLETDSIKHYDTATLIQNTVATLDANAEQDVSLEIE